MSKRELSFETVQTLEQTGAILQRRSAVSPRSRAQRRNQAGTEPAMSDPGGALSLGSGDSAKRAHSEAKAQRAADNGSRFQGTRDAPFDHSRLLLAIATRTAPHTSGRVPAARFELPFNTLRHFQLWYN